VIDRLAGLLRGHSRIALDTSVFIYHLEGSPRYSELADHVLAWLERAGHTATTSTITLTELLVQLYRTMEQRRVIAIRQLLTTLDNLEWVTPDLPIADLAARIRAEYRLQTADAIRAATAIHSGATLYVTNDQAFRRIPSFELLLLDELL
jgi:predicted nucleic acid-binding protein